MSQRLFKITLWVMIAVGIFSIVTGFLAQTGHADLLSDSAGKKTFFNFIDGGLYFMICGAIHIATAILGMRRMKTTQPPAVCILAGIFTLAWQVAAFIYLFMEGYISLRAALMLVTPLIYLTAIIIIEVQARSSLVSEDGTSDNTKKAIGIKKNFFHFDFSFRRKHFNGVHFSGKRHSAKLAMPSFSGKRRTGKINLRPRRRFKRK